MLEIRVDGCNAVFEPVLHKYLLLVRIGRILIEVKEAILCVEVYLVDNRHLLPFFNSFKREIQGNIKFFRSTRVSLQIYNLSFFQLWKFEWCQLQSPEKLGMPLKFILHLFIGSINDVAECGGICTKILNLIRVFFPTSSVQLFVHESLHRINIDQMLSNLMIRI